VASTGQLFWFIPTGNKSVLFELKKGWNVYSFSNLPDWTAQTTINSVRLDPGVAGSAKIMLDWMAISSQPVSNQLKASALVDANTATFLTSPTSNPGSYTVTVSWNGVKQSVTVLTGAVTGTGDPLSADRTIMLYPNPATNMVTLRLDGAPGGQVRFISMNGQIVKQLQLSGENCLDIPVSDLPAGTYLVLVNHDHEVAALKLIKQ
jgi:hypothetical protein